MGLLSIIRKQKRRNREIRVLMLGLDNAGKTTIVQRMLERPPDQITPTMGFEIHTCTHQGFTLNIWDIGGQSSLRGFWGNYFDKTDVVLWVVDAASAERISESFAELQDKIVNHDRFAGVCLGILVNKVDIAGEDAVRQVMAAVMKNQQGEGKEGEKKEEKMRGNDCVKNNVEKELKKEGNIKIEALPKNDENGISNANASEILESVKSDFKETSSKFATSYSPVDAKLINGNHSTSPGVDPSLNSAANRNNHTQITDVINLDSNPGPISQTYSLSQPSTEKIPSSNVAHVVSASLAECPNAQSIPITSNTVQTRVSAFAVSGKTGMGLEQVLDWIVAQDYY